MFVGTSKQKIIKTISKINQERTQCNNQRGMLTDKLKDGVLLSKSDFQCYKKNTHFIWLYTGSCLQRVRLQRALGCNEQISLHQNH